jgi:hypothetical protein
LSEPRPVRNPAGSPRASSSSPDREPYTPPIIQEPVDADASHLGKERLLKGYLQQVERHSTSRGKLHTMASDPNAEAASVLTVQKEPYTMAHLSIAPATTTTVVTTTTTTTTQFPPLLFNPPRSLSERDPKEYPLAHAHAPESLRRFCFDVGGEQACFQEAKDVADTIAEVRLTK